MWPRGTHKQTLSAKTAGRLNKGDKICLCPFKKKFISRIYSWLLLCQVADSSLWVNTLYTYISPWSLTSWETCVLSEGSRADWFSQQHNEFLSAGWDTLSRFPLHQMAVPPKALKLLGSWGFQMCLLLSIWGKVAAALILPSRYSAVRPHSHMFFGMLLTDSIIFRFNFWSIK